MHNEIDIRPVYHYNFGIFSLHYVFKLRSMHRPVETMQGLSFMGMLLRQRRGGGWGSENLKLVNRRSSMVDHFLERKKHVSRIQMP